ncbi:hypothetical protein K438DRAFT_1988721 [Mycena galopus ATCC 62051]|nr:hypothetical protein K438DRAFT_1988721 [Mycena galopus ATCC 62051]
MALRLLGFSVSHVSSSTRKRKADSESSPGSAATGIVLASVVQHYIYLTKSADQTNACGSIVPYVTCREDNGAKFETTGIYVLIAFSEILASIAGLEYAFTNLKAPKNTRSVVMSVYECNPFRPCKGLSYVSLSADPLLLRNYGAATLTALLVSLSALNLDAKEDDVCDSRSIETGIS